MRIKLYLIIYLLMISGILNAQNSDSLRRVISTLHFDLPVLSPIPETVFGVKDSKISLNGTWKFNPESVEILKASKIEVPGEWEMQGFKVPKGKTGTYWKTKLKSAIIPWISKLYYLYLAWKSKFKWKGIYFQT